ncbi:hypothetical protein GGX14DRAFT_580934 [Mycena pura]|uniref:Uncharacterized protein n=1 Tax=Mycena pura TaxID=153505 RepID=A0AAD6UKF1_9AGAR|nr:hypothetical protein GGX14DRAFT_580934 [Mycena pura]
MAYMGQLRLDGYAEIVDHAVRRKAQFDKKVLARAPKEVTVIFKTGSLVQVYNTKYEAGATFLVERKMVSMWSAPRRITSRSQNSYKLETLEGLPLGSRWSSRLLRQFIPRRRSTLLHELQLEWARGLEELGIVDKQGDEDTPEPGGATRRHDEGGHMWQCNLPHRADQRQSSSSQRHQNIKLHSSLFLAIGAVPCRPPAKPCRSTGDYVSSGCLPSFRRRVLISLDSSKTTHVSYASLVLPDMSYVFGWHL